MRVIKEDELAENFRKYKNFEGAKEQETKSTEGIKISTKKQKQKKRMC